MIIILILHKSAVVVIGSHPDSADLVRELEEDEDGDHDPGHDEADEGPVGEHDEGFRELDGEWGLIFWRLDKDGKNKSVSRVARIPVLPERRQKYFRIIQQR